MRSLSGYKSNLSGSSDVPGLSQREWNVLAVPAAVLAVMAILQAISFGKFKDWLDGVGVGWPALIAAVLIVAELFGAVSLLRLPMSAMVRKTGLVLAVLATGFWFFKNIQLVSSGAADASGNSGFFGKYLTQAPGWWTVIEITVLLFLVIYAVKAFRRAS
jgi:hypothetical protein